MSKPMYKINLIAAFICFTLVFCSCNRQVKRNEACRDKLKTARDLVYANYNRQSALDSALHITNECMQCDSLKKEVVDFKITLLITMKRYIPGIAFIDSLKESDFTFGYKQRFLSKGLRALEYNSIDDTAKRDLMYKEIKDDIGQYVKSRTIGDKEFKEIYTDLFSVMENYLDGDQINEEVKALKMKYPEKQSFFDFFKK
ncbi:MAG: hypothetical protein ABL876_11720 [Chitinophagaceae bacterium]